MNPFVPPTQVRPHPFAYRAFRLLRTPRDLKATSSFSLVEVALAIGIIATSCVVLIGMLSPGLTIHRQALDNSVGSQIVQRLFNEAQQTDFPALIQAKSTMRYFDNQGNEVAQADSQYTAEISVLPTTKIPSPDNRSTESLATVTVKLANNPAHIPDPFASYGKVPYGTFFAYIAKSQ